MQRFTMYRRNVPDATHDANQKNAPDEPQLLTEHRGTHAMTRDELSDIRVQRQLQRSLTVTLMDSIAAAVEFGLHPDNAAKAVQEVWESEQRLAHSSRALATR